MLHATFITPSGHAFAVCMHTQLSAVAMKPAKLEIFHVLLRKEASWSAYKDVATYTYSAQQPIPYAWT